MKLTERELEEITESARTGGEYTHPEGLVLRLLEHSSILEKKNRKLKEFMEKIGQHFYQGMILTIDAKKELDDD